MIGRLRRRALGAIAGVLVPVMRRRPGVILWLADLAGALSFMARTRELRTLFPHLSPGDARKAMKRLWIAEARNLLLLRSARLGSWSPVHALLGETTRIAALRPPLILATFHAGAAPCIGAVSKLLPGSCHSITAAAGRSEEHRIRSVYDAVQRLRQGDFVLIAVDGQLGTGFEAPCLGRSLPLARGALAIARISGVPIVPILMRWEGKRAEPVIGEPIAVTAEGESAAAAGLGRWLEEQLLRSPETIGAHLLRRFRV
jgi:hypothetical protein